VEQDGIAGLHRVHRLDEKLCGHALQQRRGGAVSGYARRQSGDELGWRNAVFRVGTHGIRGRDAVTRPQLRYPVADCLDGAGNLGAHDERQLVRIQP
jgi:hypothetical protein